MLEIKNNGLGKLDKNLKFATGKLLMESFSARLKCASCKLFTIGNKL